MKNSMSKIQVLMCSFQPIVGWRVRRTSTCHTAKVAVVDMDYGKVMRIPTAEYIRPGSFVNPIKVVDRYLKENRV